MGWNLPEQVRLQADAIGELQLKRTQSGSSSRSGRNRGRAAEANASGEQQLKRRNLWAADRNGEKQFEADRCNRGAPAEATQSGSSSSAQRAVRRRITHVGE